MVTQNMLHTHEGKYDFFSGMFRNVLALDLNRCVKQIKKARSIHTCAPISELPPNISTITYI